ncbi:hypothetical protein G9C84_16420, partial [Halolamina sp. R1-12]|nr:hypothetical protein [Halolamina sp. R1-12]
MSTDAAAVDDDVADAPSRAELAARVEELEEELADVAAETGEDEKKMSIIATKGTLDM